MLKTCCSLSSEMGNIMPALAIIVPILIEATNHGKRKGHLTLVVLSTVLCIFLIGNHYAMQKYTMIPTGIIDSTYKSATSELEKAELRWNLPSSDTTAIDSQIIDSMDKEEGSIVPKHTQVHLYYREPDKGVPGSSDPALATLDIQIDSAEVFQDGFHYEFPDPENPERTVLIDFTKGLSGKFHYTWPLSEEEASIVGHGGKLYDENMNEISGGIYWSDTNGNFAMQFPDDLPSGTYVYELYQVLNGTFMSSRIRFSF